MVISTSAVRCFFRDSSNFLLGYIGDGGTSFTAAWETSGNEVFIQKYNYATESESWLRKLRCVGTWDPTNSALSLSRDGTKIYQTIALEDNGVRLGVFHVINYSTGELEYSPLTTYGSPFAYPLFAETEDYLYFVFAIEYDYLTRIDKKDYKTNTFNFKRFPENTDRHTIYGLQSNGENK